MEIVKKNNGEAQAGIVETSAKIPSARWYGVGIGIVGGVVGAVTVLVLNPLFQSEERDNVIQQIEAQTERIEDLKTDKEKEFSRVFNAIADLEGNNRKHEASINALNVTVNQTTTKQENQATQLQDLTEATVALTEEMDGLKNRLTQIEVQASSNPSQLGEAQVDWEGQLGALKTQMAALERQISTLPQIMQELKEQKESFFILIDGQNVSIESIVADMTTGFEQQKKAIEELTRHVAEIRRAPPASNQSLAMLVAAQTLKSAIDRGGSYKNELQIFAPLAPADLSLDILEKYADSGLPNVAELTSRFTKLADEIAALDKNLPEDASLTDQLLQQGSRLYSSRPVGEVEGSSAAAIAARMEMAIGQGDLVRALNEAQDLPPEAKMLGADFIELLKARENVDALLQRLIAELLQEKE